MSGTTNTSSYTIGEPLVVITGFLASRRNYKPNEEFDPSDAFGDPVKIQSLMNAGYIRHGSPTQTEVSPEVAARRKAKFEREQAKVKLAEAEAKQRELVQAAGSRPSRSVPAPS